MARLSLCILMVLVIFYVVPFLVYGLFASLKLVKPPQEESVAQFLLSILVQKVGHAAAFVLLFHFAREVFGGQWLLYGLLWWVMFAIGEIGTAIGPKYTWPEAVAGIASETVYLPLSAFLTSLLIGRA